MEIITVCSKHEKASDAVIAKCKDCTSNKKRQEAKQAAKAKS